MIEIRPQPGPQTAFLSCSADVAVFGGSAGSSKTFGLLLEASRNINNPDYGGVIFRREQTMITNEGGLRDTALQLYPHLGGEYRSQPYPHFLFPSGARISFRHLNQENDVLGWQGSQIPFIGYDELTHYSAFQFWYMFSRLRSTSGVRPYIRATTNPDAESWVADLLEWWIDQDSGSPTYGLPIPERSGVIRYFARINNELMWADSIEDLVSRHGCDYLDAKSFTFIPAKITDNPILMKKDPAYLANLKALTRVERARLLDGNWKVRPKAGDYFPRDAITVIDWRPTDVVKWIRSWDLAATEEGDGRDPDWTVGLLVGRRSNGKIVVADMIRVRRKAAVVESLVKTIAARDGKDTWILLPQDPGQSGKPIFDEEKVLKGDGSIIPLKNIVVGDFVIGIDGNPHHVTDVFVQGNIPTLKIKTESGRSIIAGLDHSFLTTEGWVEARNLSVNDVLALMVKPNITINYDNLFKTEKTKEEFRLAGYFIGDGSVGIKKGTKSSNAGFCCNDELQLNDFKYCAESIGGIIVNRNKRGMDYGVSNIQKWLRDTGISGKTAYNKRVPDWVFNASNECIANFIGAYFACDGTVSSKGDDVIFYSVCRELLEDIQSLLLRFGISSTIKKKNGTYLKTRHVSYLLRMKGQDDAYRRFANKIPVYHTLKKQRLLDLSSKSRFRRFDERFLPDRIIDIEHGGINPCRCLSVDKAMSFVVNDIVVHNSQKESFVGALYDFTVLSRTITKNKVAIASGGANSPASLWQQGQIEIVRAPWNKDFIDEMDAFPTKGVHDDVTDSFSNGVRQLPGHSKPDYSQSGLSGTYRPLVGKERHLSKKRKY